MILQLICHTLHIASTCTSLGGPFYARTVLIPNLKYVPENAREDYLSRMIQRFAYIKWTGVVIVAVTGIIQWFDVFPAVMNKQGYIGAFTVKMIGAFGLFTITFLLAIPDERLKWMKSQRAFWSGLNIFCGLTVLIGAAMMRAARLGQL